MVAEKARSEKPLSISSTRDQQPAEAETDDHAEHGR